MFSEKNKLWVLILTRVRVREKGINLMLSVGCKREYRVKSHKFREWVVMKETRGSWVGVKMCTDSECEQSVELKDIMFEGKK